MKTYSDWLTYYQKKSNSKDEDEARENLNEGKIQTQSALETYINQVLFTADTVASQDAYQLPIGTDKVENITVTYANKKYSPREVSGLDQWNLITISNTETSQYPTHVYTDKNKIYLYPKPSSSDGVIGASISVIDPEMSKEDISTGTISATNGSATVTGSGTVFTSEHVGWKIKLPDGYWYEIKTVSSGISIVLTKLYEGITTTGASYRAGQVARLPEPAQMLPVYYALMLYFADKDAKKAANWAALYTGNKERGDGILGVVSKYLNRSTTLVYPGSISKFPVRNPNDYPTVT